MRLSYIGPDELARIRSLDADPAARAAAFADACRINALYMIRRAGSGHVGTSFSCMDVLSWLHLEAMQDGDRYFSSKGHDAPGLYSVLIGLGRLDFDLIHQLRRLGGLPGHPDVPTTPEVHTNTGSLGMGVSKARGFVLADRALGRPARDVYVLTGDGELQEGQFWESLQPTANLGLGEITVIVDHNKLQSDTWVSEVSDLGDLERKVEAFGWAVARVDGNDVPAFAGSLAELRRRAPETPRLIVADTLKGAGVSFMEPHDLPVAGNSLYGFHSGAPSPDEYERGLKELQARLGGRLEELGAAPVTLEGIEVELAEPPASPQRLIDAYGRALVDAGREHPELVALDGDLALDTGLMPFRAEFPDRFIECGIAEQDMVSQAGAMALSGILPVVHSFACFLSTRPNEQIYNNSTERTKVIYVGSLAGLLPGGPGHSHQSVRDIAALGGMPGMTMVEPASERETEQVVSWAVGRAAGPVYIRLVSIPVELPFEPAGRELEPGRGTVVREPGEVVLVAAGPVMLAQAWRACELAAEEGVQWGLIAMPWLNEIDAAWLGATVESGHVVTIDNHYRKGGLGDAVLAALAPEPTRVDKLAVDSIPACGTADEVLQAHSLDAESIHRRVAALSEGR